MKSRKHRAFTLIELLVVVAIIALLIAILLPSLGRARAKANNSKCAANVRSMGLALQLYLSDWQKMLPFTGSTGDSWTQLLGAKGGAGYGAVAKLRICPEAQSTSTTNVAVQPWYGAAHLAWGNSQETGPDPITGLALTASYGINGFLYNANPAAAIASIGGSAAKCYSLPAQKRETDIPAFVDCVWRHVLPEPTDLPGANLETPGPDSLTDHPISKIMINRHNKAVNVAFLDGHAQLEPLRDLYTLSWSKDWARPPTIPTIPPK